MEKLLSFIREYLNTRWERKQFCKSCELLKTELDRANFEKKQLMDKFVLISAPPVMRDEPVSQPLMPKNVPWKIKRELLEAEDRAKAAALRRQREDAEKAKSAELSIDELEKELSIGGENG